MPNKLQYEQPVETARQTETRKALQNVISEQVIDALGYPDDLRQMHVSPLWAGHYRVNVFCGKNVGALRVAHSFFLTVDDDGRIIDSAPKLAKQY